MSAASHEDHFKSAPPDVRQRLEQIQAEVERRVPGAQRCVGYQMPAFRMGRIFFYFAALKKHIGVYPPVTGPGQLLEQLAPYRGPKGNLSFPHAKPIPIDLIGRVAETLAEQYGR
ncbi:MAG: hypothetical protein KJ622_14625 [Alphaproteobacteria bacterium]|nr:hypothetical protein [Alphaproteobacteria bacterium]